MVSNWSQPQQAQTLRWEDLLDSISTEVHLAVAVLVKGTAPPSWSCCIRSQHKRCPNVSRCCFHTNSSPHSDELLSDPCWSLNTQWFSSFSREVLSPEVFRWGPWLPLGLYQNVPFPNIFRMFYLKSQWPTCQVFQSPFSTFFVFLLSMYHMENTTFFFFLSCLFSVLSCTQRFLSICSTVVSWAFRTVPGTQTVPLREYWMNE